MSEQEIAWLAGYFEGEACFSTRGEYSVCIQIACTDRDVLERVKAITGCGNILGPYSRNNPKWNDYYLWNITKRQEVKKILNSIYPLMGERRKARIDEIRPIFERESRQGARTDLSLSI